MQRCSEFYDKNSAALFLRADLPPPTDNYSIDGTLKLQTAQNAPASNGPVSLVIRTAEAKDQPLLSRPATLDLRGENRRGTSLLDSAERIWLTVVPEAPKGSTDISRWCSEGTERNHR